MLLIIGLWSIIAEGTRENCEINVSSKYGESYDKI